MIEDKKYYCEVCKSTLGEQYFYKSHNLEKYPNQGILKRCKKCFSMHIDNWNPDTYLPLLEELDVPYIPEEWEKLMMRYCKPGTKVTGTTILGRYLSKMKLKQWNQYRWRDTDFLKEIQLAKMKQAMQNTGRSAAEITVALEEAAEFVPGSTIEKPQAVAEVAPASSSSTSTPEEMPLEEEAIESSLVEGLTEEDRTYLRLKWGRGYRPDEQVRLEQLFSEMMESYDIQSAGDKNTLILACKASLKANQLMDVGDIDGAQKATKMYDSLMKSGKWTAAQIKVEENDLVDSIGELVALCEKDGFIPRYYTDGPQDKVDRVLADMQQYTHDLITEELGLGAMIESALRKIEEEKESLENNTGIGDSAEGFEEQEEERLFDYSAREFEDSDFEDFAAFKEQIEKQDAEYFELLRQKGGK